MKIYFDQNSGMQESGDEKSTTLKYVWKILARNLARNIMPILTIQPLFYSEIQIGLN